ncbi:DUF4400 domain-containing protein, partial [Halomonas sp. THAF12]|uniref:DUF4400 domain-containing protein n=1 Tax=Halomonas sp. B23F22_10 TaxID=3459515 RepID=UPI00373E7C68
MAVDSAERTQKRRPGIFGNLVGIPLRIAIVVLVSLICSVVIEWLGIAFEWWHLPGAEHARVTMENEMGWLDTRYTRSLLVSDPVQAATWALTTVNDWLFVKTGIAGWLADNAGQGGIPGIIHTYTQAAMYVVLMTLTRCVILALTSPLFFL